MHKEEEAAAIRRRNNSITKKKKGNKIRVGSGSGLLYYLKQHTKLIFGCPIIRYVLKTLLHVLLGEITPLKRLFYLKLFTAIFVIVPICK